MCIGIWFERNLECYICARIAYARVTQVDACAALLVTHPLDLWGFLLLLQGGQRSEKYANGVTAAYSVLGACQVLRERVVGLRGCERRHCEEFHRLVVQSRDGCMDRMSPQ